MRNIDVLSHMTTKEMLKELETIHAAHGVCDEEPSSHVPHSLVEWDVQRRRFMPKFPPCRVVYDGEEGNARHKCPYCSSSLKRRWIFWRRKGCIQPECLNYFDPPGLTPQANLRPT